MANIVLTLKTFSIDELLMMFTFRKSIVVSRS